MPSAAKHCGNGNVEPLGNRFLVTTNRPKGPGWPAECIYVKDEIWIDEAAPEARGLVPLNFASPTTNADGGDGALAARVDAVGPYPAMQLYRLADNADPFDVASGIVRRGGFAAPNYVFSPGQVFRFGPYDDAQAKITGQALQGKSFAGNAGAGSGGAATPVTVDVVDTGLDTTGWPKQASGGWGVPTGKPEIDNLGRAAGHGTFISSIIARFVPSASIKVTPLPTTPTTIRPYVTAQLLAESDLVAAVQAGTGQILNLSLSTYGCAAAGSAQNGGATPCVPNALRSALLTRHTKSGLKWVVTAAGNDDVTTPTYPAAFALNPCFGTDGKCGSANTTAAASAKGLWLFGVGTNEPASDGKQFSNSGPWVALLAEGGEVYGWHPPTSPGLNDYGIYQWSGTSFAAPCVAAHLASGNEPIVRAAIADKAAGKQTRLSCNLHDMPAT